MSTLKLPSHKRGRSSSTTTAIQLQRPCLVAHTTMTGRPRRGSTGDCSDNVHVEKPEKLKESSSTSFGSVWIARVSRLWRSNDNQLLLPSPSSTPSMSSPISSPSVSHPPVPVWNLPQSAGSSSSMKVYGPLLFVILLFPLTTSIVVGSIWSLPIRLPSVSTVDGTVVETSLPRTVADVKALGWALKSYAEAGPWELGHVLGVLSITALWKHAWSVPGSVLLNILTGILLSPIISTLLQTSLTTVGSLLSTILATPLAPLITRFFPSAISLTRNALEGSKTTSITRPVSPVPLSESRTISKPATAASAWARLSVLRLIGVVPWSGINVACGVCSVNLWHCAVGAFIGTLPWTAVTCQIGDILQTLANSPNSSSLSISSVLSSPDVIIKLVFLTLLSLAPVLGREKLTAFLGGLPSDEENSEALLTSERRNRRRGHKKGVFSTEWWRQSISLSSRAGPPEDPTVELIRLKGEQSA